MTGELLRADEQAQLLVTTFVQSQQSPEVWDKFCDRMFAKWESDANREHVERQIATGWPTATDATQPGNGVATPDNDAAPSQQLDGQSQAVAGQPQTPTQPDG